MCEKIWWIGYHHLLLLLDGLDSFAHIAVWDELEDNVDLVEECEIDKEKKVEEKEEVEKEKEVEKEEEEVDKKVFTLS